MKGRSTVVRAIAVFALAGVVGGVLAAGPAGAGKFLTKKKALKLFYTKGDADARFLNVGEAIPGTVYYRRGAQVAVANATETSASVACPTGTEPVGGGGWTSNVNMPLTSSAPSDAAGQTGFTGWTAWARNESGSPGTLRAYVVCVNASAIDANYTAGATLIR